MRCVNTLNFVTIRLNKILEYLLNLHKDLMHQAGTMLEKPEGSVKPPPAQV